MTFRRRVAEDGRMAEHAAAEAVPPAGRTGRAPAAAAA